MDFGALSDRLNFLLEGQTVKWVRQNDAKQITIQFCEGPLVYINLWNGEGELDISVVGSSETKSDWFEKAESEDGSKPPKRS